MLRTEPKDEKRYFTTRFARGTEFTEEPFSPLAGDAAKGKDFSLSGTGAGGELILPCSHLPAKQKKNKVVSVFSLRGVGPTLRPVSPPGWKRGRRPIGAEPLSSFYF